MAKKSEPTKVLCARVKPDIYEPIYQIRDRDRVKVSELIREGLRGVIVARSPFERAAVKELERAATPAEVEEIAVALVGEAQTKKEEAFIEQAATAALEVVSAAPLQLESQAAESLRERYARELRKPTSMDAYRRKVQELGAEAKKAGAKAQKVFHEEQRQAREELTEALRLQKLQEKDRAKTLPKRGPGRPKKEPGPPKEKKPRGRPPKAKKEPTAPKEKKPRGRPKKAAAEKKPKKPKAPRETIKSVMAPLYQQLREMSSERGTPPPDELRAAEAQVKNFVDSHEATGFSNIGLERKAADLGAAYITAAPDLYHPTDSAPDLRRQSLGHADLARYWFDKGDRKTGLWYRALSLGFDKLSDLKENAPIEGETMPRLKQRPTKEAREHAKRVKEYAARLKNDNDTELIFEHDRITARHQRAINEHATDSAARFADYLAAVHKEMERRGLAKKKSPELSKNVPVRDEDVDIFVRTKRGEPAGAWKIRLPSNLPIEELITQASEFLGKKLRQRGSKGVFEVQTDAGIWSRPGGGVFYNNKGELFGDVAFKTWEAIEAEEEKAPPALPEASRGIADFVALIHRRLGHAPTSRAEVMNTVTELKPQAKNKDERAALRSAQRDELARINNLQGNLRNHKHFTYEALLGARSVPELDRIVAELLANEDTPSRRNTIKHEARELRKKLEPREKIHGSGAQCSSEKAPLMLGSKTHAGLEKVPARYCLIDVYELRPSNRPLSGFGYTEGYPRDAQERDYLTDKAEQLKVLEIARNFEPGLVFNANPGAIDGMPVVNQDGLVLGGNGRTMAAQIAYSEGDQAQKIRDYLRDNAKLFGFTAKQIAKVPYPVIVRRIQTSGEPQELAAWSRRLNETLSQQLDKTALAVSRAKFLPPQVLQALKIPDDSSVGVWLASMDSKPFVEGLKSVGVIDARNFKTFIDPQTGLLSADGRDIVIDLIVAVLIPDAQLLKSLGPGVVGTIARGAPYLAEMKAWGASPFNLAPSLVGALQNFVDWRSKNQSIETYINQGSLLGPAMTRAVKVWLQIVVELSASPVRFMRVSRFYVQEARGPAAGQVALFAAESRTPVQILEAAALSENITLF